MTRSAKAKSRDAAPVGISSPEHAARLAKLQSLRIDDRDAVGAKSGTNGWLVLLLLLQTAGLGWLLTGGSIPWLNAAEDNVALFAAPPTEAAAPVAQSTETPIAPVIAAPEPELVAQGYVEARKTVIVRSRVFGVIASLPVEEGSFVEKGAVLAEFETADAELERDLTVAQIASSRARLSSAAVAVETAQAALDREQALFTQGQSTAVRLANAQAELRIAEATRDSAQADLTLAEIRVARADITLKNHVIRAPFDGVLLRLRSELGDVLSPQTGTLGLLVDMSSLEISVDVSEQLIAKVKEGQKVNAVLYAYDGLEVEGEVLAITSEVDRAKATVRVRIRLLTDDPRILPDMGVKVNFL